MVLDSTVLSTSMSPFAGLPQGEESPVERAARIHELSQRIRDGSYSVHAYRLARALLEWDPRRGTQKHSAEVADRRRAYMREYMRRRRADQANETTSLQG